MRRIIARETANDDRSVTVFYGQLGWMACRWNGPILETCGFAYSSEAAARRGVDPERYCAASHAPLHLEVAERLQAYAEGQPDDFLDLRLSLEHLSPFQQSVVHCCRKIGWGHTTTYGQLARAAGRPGAARAVGTVMAKNRFPLIVPCHRVLASGGKIGGYSAPDGIHMKRKLLDREARIAPRRVPPKGWIPATFRVAR